MRVDPTNWIFADVSPPSEDFSRVTPLTASEEAAIIYMPPRIPLPPVERPNYVPRTLLDELSISLNKRLLDKLPYEDNGRITFKNLVSFLSKEDTKKIDEAKTDGQIIDKQIGLLFDMKKKAKQVTQYGYMYYSERSAIAKDIRKTIDIFDELAYKASFNNRPLNKVDNDLKIGITRSDNIGNTRFATGANILEPRKVSISFFDSNNKRVNIKEVEIGIKNNTGVKALSEAINDEYDKLKIKASWSVESTGSHGIRAGNIKNLTINGITLGNIDNILKNDSNGMLVAVINNVESTTGVEASIDARGHLVLNSKDGKGIVVTVEEMKMLSLDTQPNSDGSPSNKHSNYGKLTLVKSNSNDIKMVDNEASKYIGFSKDKVSESTINLRALKSLTYTAKEALSIGVSSNDNSLAYQQAQYDNSFPASVISYQSAIMSDKIFDSSILQLREIKNILDANKQTPIYQEAKTSKGVLVSKNI